MRKLLIITLSVLFVATACTTKTRQYTSPDGTVEAICTYSGSDSTHAQWQFLTADGKPLVEGCDSVRVLEMGPEGHPMTVCFHKDNQEIWKQFYSTMQLRCEGVTVNGLREGLWVYYFPSGNRQTEATFVGGKEEGPYRVYRDNGVPYYIGQYRGGQRYGIWEVYDPEGSLTGTKEFFNEE